MFLNIIYKGKTMILTLWTILLILSFALLIIGYIFYQSSVSDILIIVGWSFIFFLGVILLLNAVEYSIGETETINYTYSEYNYIVDGTNYTAIVINNSITTLRNDYEAFSSEGSGALQRVANSHAWGFLLMIAGLMGAILFWFDVKRYSNEVEESEIEES